MTLNFDRFVELFLEAKSFTELPDKAPYGFWISPHGDFFVVNFEDHHNVAKKIINNTESLKTEYDKNPYFDLYFFLASRKYIRVVRDSTGIPIYYADVHTYDDAGIVNEFTPTISSMRTLKDIGEFYGKTIHLVKQ